MWTNSGGDGDPSAVGVRLGDGRFLPQAACAGAWTPEELHVSPVNGLLVHELERSLAERPADLEKVATRRRELVVSPAPAGLGCRLDDGEPFELLEAL